LDIKFLAIAGGGIGLLGLIAGLLLGYIAKVLKIKVDERVKAIEEILPGANCGACGYPGCSGYASAIINENAPINLCAPGGEEVMRKIAKLLGREAVTTTKKIARVRCSGDTTTVKRTAEYDGITSCQALEILGGNKECPYGCLGLGDCVDACPFDAIYMGDDGLPHVIEEKCTGCGLCVQACPRNIIELVPATDTMYVKCVSPEFGSNVMKVCKKGCIGCSLCARMVNFQGIKMENNLPVINYSEYKGSEEIAQKCPTKVIKLIRNGKSQE